MGCGRRHTKVTFIMWPDGRYVISSLFYDIFMISRRIGVPSVLRLAHHPRHLPVASLPQLATDNIILDPALGAIADSG